MVHIMQDQLIEMKIEDLMDLNQEIANQIYSLLEKEVKDNLSCFEEDKFICHHCSGTHTCKAGKSKQGKQRYKCHDCNRFMIADRNTITFSSKKEFSQWVVFTKSLFDQDSLTVSAKKANISKRTSFRWRHKILYLLNSLLNKEALNDVVYVDETMFPVVYKNPKNPNMVEVKKRGMSNQKINVTCAIDSKQQTILSVVDKGRVLAKSLIEVYDGKIEKGAIVVSDSLRSYHRLMKYLKVDWKKIPSKKKSIEQYNLEPINRLHALIKDFFFKYKGISIKYLQGYLALFDYQNKHRNHYDETVFHLIIKQIFSGYCNLKCIQIDSGNPLY